jgi:hypothetical protein
LKSRIPLIKHFLSKESDKLEETTYHLSAALADFTVNRYKDLVKYVPSILYLLYVDDIVTEEFWIKYAIKANMPHYDSKIFTQEVETKFLDAANEFTNWIENAPYEDEEDRSYVPVDKSSSTNGSVSQTTKTKPKAEEIDIDDI